MVTIGKEVIQGRQFKISKGGTVLIDLSILP